ncbi:MAG: MFS transporter [bacterium]|nr:MFS transporter [bacterium]
MRIRFTGLWTHPDFLKLWFGQTISEFGSRITRDGLPLAAVLVLGASPAQMGILRAVSSLPVLVFGLFAGVLVDRLPRRPVMIACDLVRLCVLLTIPFAALTGSLSMPLIYVVSALMAVLALIFDIAYRAYLPSLIDRAYLTEGNAKLSTTDALAEIGGPALTGLLIQVMSAPSALLFDSFSFLFSVVSVSAIRTPEPPPVRTDPGQEGGVAVTRELREGIARISGDPLLLTLAVGTGLRAFFGNFIGTLYDLFTVRELGLSPLTLGLLVACGGIGALIGAGVATTISRRIGTGYAIIGALIISGLVNLLIPLAADMPGLSLAMLVAAQIIGDGAMMVYWINEVSLRQTLVADHLLGRVNAGFGFLGEGLSVFGALAAGALATGIGTRLTLWAAVLGILCSALGMGFSPLKRLNTVKPVEMENDKGVRG